MSRPRRAKPQAWGSFLRPYSTVNHRGASIKSDSYHLLYILWTNAGVDLGECAPMAGATNLQGVVPKHRNMKLRSEGAQTFQKRISCAWNLSGASLHTDRVRMQQVAPDRVLAVQLFNGTQEGSRRASLPCIGTTVGVWASQHSSTASNIYKLSQNAHRQGR